MTISYFAKHVITIALNGIFPPSCLICSAELISPQLLCGLCAKEINEYGDKPCLYCGADVSHSAARICNACETNLPLWTKGVSVAAYDGVAKALTLSIKNKYNPEVFDIIAKKIYDRNALLKIGTPDMLIPMPLHWSRLWKRQYNQAAEIAKRLAQYFDIEVDYSIRRKNGWQKDQKKLNFHERQLAMKNSFVIKDKAKLRGKHIGLVDDVLTTGASLNALTNILKSADVASIQIFVFARTEILD